ncbi:hypothetical protein PMIN02_007836 [Paraphaeosphaeria minitans]
MHFIQDMWQSFRWRFAMQERLFVVWDTPQEAGLVSPAAVLQCFDLDRTAGDVGFHSAEVVFRFEGAFDMGNAAAGGGPRAQFGGGARCRQSKRDSAITFASEGEDVVRPRVNITQL